MSTPLIDIVYEHKREVQITLLIWHYSVPSTLQRTFRIIKHTFSPLYKRTSILPERNMRTEVIFVSIRQ